LESQEKSVPSSHLYLWANVESLDWLGEAHVLRCTSWSDLVLPSQKVDFRYDKVLDFENKVRSPWASPRAPPYIAASAKKHPAPIEGEELRPWRAPRAM
jgi:hypothetical protein